LRRRLEARVRAHDDAFGLDALARELEGSARLRNAVGHVSRDLLEERRAGGGSVNCTLDCASFKLGRRARPSDKQRDSGASVAGKELGHMRRVEHCDAIDGQEHITGEEPRGRCGRVGDDFLHALPSASASNREPERLRVVRPMHDYFHTQYLLARASGRGRGGALGVDGETRRDLPLLSLGSLPGVQRERVLRRALGGIPQLGQPRVSLGQGERVEE
jgi:hypothetical protein